MQWRRKHGFGFAIEDGAHPLLEEISTYAIIGFAEIDVVVEAKGPGVEHKKLLITNSLPDAISFK
jgi:hypothetical protein